MNKLRWFAAGGTLLAVLIGCLIGLSSRKQFADYQYGERLLQDFFEVRIACFTYADDHGGRFPADWQGVLSYSNQTLLHIYRYSTRAKTSVKDSIFLSPKRWPDYEYFGGMSTDSPPDLVLFYPARRGKPMRGSRVLLVDCSIPWLEYDELTNSLEKTSRFRSELTNSPPPALKIGSP